MTLFFFSNFHVGGAQKIAINLINSLNKKEDIFNEIIAINNSGPLKKNISNLIKINNFNKKKLIYCVFKYIKYVKKNNVDKIFCVQPHSVIFCYFMNFLLNKKIKIIARETNSYKKSIYRQFSLKEKIFLVFKNFVYKKIHLVICPSRGLKNEVKGRKKFISNFVDIRFLKKKKTKKKEGNYLLGVGRLVKQKRFQDLIYAFNLIHDEIKEKLIIIGEGPEKTKLDKLIKKLNLKKKITILPFQNYLKYLANCKVFVSTSAWEGMPNMLIEAVVLEKRIVATNCNHGPKEILLNGKYGHLCKVGDINEISNKISKQLKSKRIKVTDRFTSRFSMDYALKEYYQIFKK